MIALPDENILLLLHRLHYATVEQVIHRFYSPSSRTTVQTRMKKLTELGYVERFPLRRKALAGSGPLVYTLAHRGRSLLRDLGCDIRERYRLSEESKHSGEFFEHTLAVNDFLISCELLDEARDDVTLTNYVHEREMRRVVPRGVIPDAWVDISVSGVRYPLLLEANRSRIEQRRFRGKLQGLVRFLNTAYPKLFKTDMGLVVIVAPSEARRRSFETWIARELPLDTDIFRLYERATG